MADTLDFSGKTVLVVGGSSGIGNGIAQAFQRNGAEVHVWGTRPRAEDYAGEEGSDLSQLVYAQMDVSDFAAVEAYTPAFAKLDVLVNCQGIVIYKRGEFAMDGFRRVIDVNLNSVMATAMRFRAMLSASRGSIINIASTSAYHTTVGNPAYGTSKAACVALTRNLAAELGPVAGPGVAAVLDRDGDVVEVDGAGHRAMMVRRPQHCRSACSGTWPQGGGEPCANGDGRSAALGCAPWSGHGGSTTSC